MAYQQWTELELFEAVGRGDDGAFGEFKARIERCVRFVAADRGRGMDGADREEVTGRVLAKLEGLRQRGFSGNNQAFRTYLYKVVASQAVELVKERAHLVSLDQPVELPDGEMKPLRERLAELIESRWNVLKELEAQGEIDLFRDAWAALDERCRGLLWLKEVERHPEREIAETLKMTVSNVWASIHRCKDKLSRLLLTTIYRARDPVWQEKITSLARKLVDPLATIFGLWWGESCTIREIARRLHREEAEVKELLARAKAAVWQLAQETGDP